MSDDEPVCAVRDLTAGYRRRRVFSGLDLELSSGVTALLGPNGAGKTTLMSLLCGMRRAERGEIRVLGVSMASARDRRQIAGQLGLLPQSFGYYPGYRLREFIEVAAWLKKVPAGQISAAVDEALGLVGLSERAESSMRSLSGGMLRRAGIAQAVVHRPRLLIMDEPSAGLDPHQRIALRRLIGRLAESSSVLLSTHLVDDVAVVARRIVVLDDGVVRFTGSPSELCGHARAGVEGDSPLERGYSAVLGHPTDLP